MKAKLAEVGADRWRSATAVCLVAAAAAATLMGGFGALVVVAFGAALVGALARALLGASESTVLRVVLIAFSARVIVAVGVHSFLVQRGTDGSMFFDDAGYILSARTVLHAWRGSVLSAGEIGLLSDSSISAAYITFSAAVFWLVGENVLALKLVNVAIGVLQAPILVRTMRNLGIPGEAAAGYLLLAFPSLILWSSLALKDAISGALMLTAVWSVSEHQQTRRWWPWLVTIPVLIVLRDLRVYLFVILALAWPVALLLTGWGMRRVPRAGLALAVSFVLIFTHTPSIELLDARVISGIASTRASMAQDARSAFVRPPPIAAAAPGQAFQVEVPGRSCEPDATRQRHEVPGGSQLVVEGERTAVPLPGATPRAIVKVRACDIIVIVDSAAAARSTADPATNQPTETAASLPRVRVEPEKINLVETPTAALTERESFEQGAGSNLQHLPVGILYALTAPSPFTARTFAEFALAPEMLLWYVLMFLAVAGLLQVIWRRNVAAAMPIMTVGAIFLVISLTEGNVGTLVRHRAMLIPFVIMLAAGGAWSMWRPVRRVGMSSHSDVA